MVKCLFSGKEMPSYKGIHLLKNDGTVEYYSSGKVFKNAINLKRDRRRVKWTEAFRINREKIRVKEAAVKSAAEDKAKKSEKSIKSIKEKKIE